ncbi:MAG: FtsB family cell division protein [Nitrospiria bacterium]
MNPNVSRQHLDALFKKKKKRVYFVTGLVLSYFLIWSLFGEVNLPDYYSMRKTYNRMKGEINQLKTENARLKKQSDALRSDPQQIESLAREELGLAKKGEIIYEFPKSASPSSKP